VKVGILALQGAFREHAQVFTEFGVEPLLVREPEQVAAIDALVLPGGESTTMSMLLESGELFDPLAARIAGGLPVLGTCAGMILLATDVLDGRADQRCFGAIDLVVRRNAFGRQVDSFEADLDVRDLPGGAFPAIFIRAPVVESAGAAVDVLATIDDRPVLCRQGAVTVAAFHPELSGDLRLHELFLKGV
jgi:5'-phosphate synthase pdxT subunit